MNKKKLLQKLLSGNATESDMYHLEQKAYRDKLSKMSIEEIAINVEKKAWQRMENK